jgi:excisionase family DNA binding protein
MVDDTNIGNMLTVSEVSQLLHVHSNTLRRWTEQGIIKAYRIGPRGDRRFRAEDIAVLFRDGSEAKAADERRDKPCVRQ